MKNFFSIAILMVCFNFVSCKKETKSTQNPSNSNQTTTVVPPHTKIVHVSNAIKEWGLFQVGSYWIVKDSASSNLDSVYVTAVTNQTLVNWVGDTNFVEEQVVIDFNSSTLHSRHHLSSYPNDNIKVSLSGPYLTVFQTDTAVVNNFGLVNYTYIPSGAIAGNNYTNLLREFHSNSVLQADHSSIVIFEEGYWKKNVGLLKLKQQGGTLGVKEVIRFAVIQ